jgi:SSS family solute:Na+ symporter
MLGIFLLGFLAKQVSNAAAKIAAIIGVLVIAWMSFKDLVPEAYQSPFDSKMTVVVGTLTIVGLGIFVQFWLKKR